MTNQQFESFQPFQSNPLSQKQVDNGLKELLTNNIADSGPTQTQVNSNDDSSYAFRKRMGFMSPTQRLNQIETKFFYETTHDSTKQQFTSNLTSSSSMIDNYSLSEAYELILKPQQNQP